MTTTRRQERRWIQVVTDTPENEQNNVVDAALRAEWRAGLVSRERLRGVSLDARQRELPRRERRPERSTELQRLRPAK